jgi:hypothetical protein
MKAFPGLKIWVHCAMNMRVSVFIYLYRRLLLGESEKDASSIMSQIWSPNEIWQEFIRDVIENFAVGGKK